MKKVICALLLMISASLSAVQYDELFDAIKQNNVLGVATILAGEKVNVNDFIDEDGQSPLCFALVNHSNISIIEQLIKYGHADVNERASEKSMLHFLFEWWGIFYEQDADYSAKVVKLFLDNGFILEVLNPVGIPEFYDFLDTALKMNNLEVANAVSAKARTTCLYFLLERQFCCNGNMLSGVDEGILDYRGLPGVADSLFYKVNRSSGGAYANYTILHLAAENGLLHIAEEILNLDKLGKYSKIEVETKEIEIEKAKAKLAEVREAESEAVTAQIVAEVQLATAKLAKFDVAASETAKDDDVLAAEALVAEAEAAQRLANEALVAEEQAVQRLTAEAQAALALTAKALAAEIANAKNCFGYTPLHDAVEGGHLDIVKLLLERGADIDAENITRTTPLQLAIDCWNEDMIKFLVAKGATYDHNALLRLAVAHGYKDLIELL